MRVRTEVVFFLLFALWVVWSASDLGGGDAPRRRGRPEEPQVYEGVPTPDVAQALPPEDRDDDFSRDLFAPPSDTSPLPPLELVLPPVEPLPALAAPTAYGPGPRAAALLSTPVQVTPVAGLFEEDLAAEAGTEEEPPLEAEAMSAQERTARIEALKRLHDWVETRGRGLRFGQIKNDERFELARTTEPILFVEIDPATGQEVYPGQEPLPLERENVVDFGLANTPENFIELRLREFEFPLRPGRFEAALTFADRCVELRNETPRALEVAERVYRALTEDNPSEVHAFLGLARCYELGFRFDEAYEAYRSMTAGRFGNEPEPWARLGDLLARFRLFDPAEEAYQEALKVRRTDWEARWRYGSFLLDRRRVEEALHHLTEAARREPTSAERREARVRIRADLGHCLLRLGRVQEAFERFGLARSANPDVDLGLAGMVSAALLLEDVDAGDVLGTNGLPEAGFDLLLAQGLTAIDREEWRDARALLERAAQADPFRAWMAWRGLSWLAELTDHPEEAFHFAERAYLAQPTDAWTLYQLGRLLAAQDDLPGARAAYRAALDQELDFTEALIGMGRLHQLAGEHEEAERYYERALAVDPDRPVVWSLRGFNHFQLGDPASAGTDFEQAIALDRSLASALNGRAWWYYAGGDAEEAMTRFGEVIDARRNAPEDDPHRRYAVEQTARIQEHQLEEMWTDRFDRIGSIANGWRLDESDGVISSLRDGQVWLEGRFEETGQGRIYQELPAERFLSVAATITIHEVGGGVSVGLFVSKERPSRTDGVRTQTKVELRRNHDGTVQVALVRRGQHDPEVQDIPDHAWPVGEPVRARIATNGDPTDTRMSLWLNDLPVLEGVEVKSLGRSKQPVRMGVAVEGQAGRSAGISVDDVQVVRRK